MSAHRSLASTRSCTKVSMRSLPVGPSSAHGLRRQVGRAISPARSASSISWLM